MVFNSFVFILLFLPITFIASRLLKEKYVNGFLLVASLLFYAWGETNYFFLLIVATLANYALGIWMEAMPKGVVKKILWLIVK